MVENEKFYIKVPQLENYEDCEQQKSTSHFKFNWLASHKGYLYAILTAFLFPTSNIFIKKANFLNGVEHLAMFFATKLIIMIIISLTLRVNLFGPRKILLLLSARGIIGSLAAILLYIGLALLPPSDCSTLVNSSIITTAIISRIFLKEKLGIAHVISLILTIFGVLLVSKPTFIPFLNLNQTGNMTDTQNQTNTYRTTLFTTVGISSVLISSLFYGVLNLLIKKLCIYECHWSIVANYDSYYGLPATILGIYMLIKFDPFDRDKRIEWTFLANQLLFSFISAIFSILGQICVTLALLHEDATKVSIVKSFDVVIAFILQLFILNISVDHFSIIGSVLILVGICFVLGFSLFEKKHKEVWEKKNSNCFKFLLFKF